jgi:D-alanyl-D-alanine carboxypeptidase/D-alanyl-D-alanine-endopeptidase (penicillin-binding protein 4)
MPMLRRSLAACAAAAIGLLAALPATPASAIDSQTLIARLTAYSAKMGPTSGAYVVDITDGLQLFAHRPDMRLEPASNEKLFTTATALQAFKPTGTLQTTVKAAAGAVVDAAGVLHGDLYLVGGGDPSLNDIALRSLVSQLRKTAHITRITGGVLGDESIFDTRRGSAASGFHTDPNLGGSLGGLTWSHGRASPGGPAAVAATRLQALLKASGVRAGHKARSGRLAKAPGGAGATLAAVSSPSMSTLIATTNQPSDNFYAETLLKDLGARFGTSGTTAAGLVVVRKELGGLGLKPTLTDGSGLSAADRTTPREIVALLRSMAAGPLATTFRASLAQPGRTGTLASRMRGTAAVGRCQAKTGTLHDVSALSGYCTSGGGHLLAFSFLENAIAPLTVKKIEDKMVPAIASYVPATNPVANPAR